MTHPFNRGDDNCCSAVKAWAYDGSARRVSVQCPWCNKLWSWTERSGWSENGQAEHEPTSLLDALSCGLQVVS